MDEEAERKAFQEAVMEWRKSANKSSAKSATTTNATNNNGGDDIISKTGESHLWSNPFSGDYVTNTHTSKGTTAAAGTGTGTAADTNKKGLLYDDDDELDEEERIPSRVSSSRGNAAASLGEGFLDEAKEHEVNSYANYSTYIQSVLDIAL